MRTFNFQLTEEQFKLTEAVMDRLQTKSMTQLYIDALYNIDTISQAAMDGFNKFGCFNTNGQGVFVEIQGVGKIDPRPKTEDEMIIPFESKK